MSFILEKTTQSTLMLQDEFAQLLDDVGRGTISNNAYDTAWLARLHSNKQLAPLADEALQWLRRNQRSDGSWGAAAPLYHHDRVICTLSAIIALEERGFSEDKPRIAAGIEALRYHQACLDLDLAGETVAFNMISPTLYIEAIRMGLLKGKSTKRLRELATEREIKLAKAPGNAISRHVTMAFSSEMIGSDGLHILHTSDLQECNGSIAHSPSATAFFLKHVDPENQPAIDYMKANFFRGGMPNVLPFDVFETAWTMWNLSLTDSINDALAAQCEPHLAFLQRHWHPQKGIGFASEYTPKDGDDTGFIFEVLSRFDKRPNIDPVLHYETDTHFKCFALESNPSISTNVHVFGALRHNGYSSKHLPVQKVIKFLKQNQHADGYWIDKWHISPYYPTSHMVINAVGYCEEIVKDAVAWLLRTQNLDGSWGVLQGTAEETAYALQALAACKKHGFDIPFDQLAAGEMWLHDHQHDEDVPLWIGKCLYTPRLVVRSTILSALLLCQEVLE